MTLYTVDTLLSLVLLSVLFAFGSSRVPALIKVMAFQGIVVSIYSVFHHPGYGDRCSHLYSGHPGDPGGSHSAESPYRHQKKWPSSGRCPRLWGTMPLCSAGWA